jgi:predicted MFS family arabinose efflux permease
MNDIATIITLVGIVLGAFLTGYIARAKGYSFIAWFFAGLFFQIIALPIAIFMKQNSRIAPHASSRK